MNKTIVITGIVILVLVGGSLYVVNQNSQQAKMAQEKAAMEEKAAMKAKEEPSMKKDEAMDKNATLRYVEYSKSALDQAGSARRVLFFYANWCPTCRPTDANLKENAGKIPQDLTVIRVNYNDPDTDQEEKDLAKKYAVTYQHTFVQIDSQGKEIVKWNGGQINELLNKIR